MRTSVGDAFASCSNLFNRRKLLMRLPPLFENNVRRWIGLKEKRVSLGIVRAKFKAIEGLASSIRVALVTALLSWPRSEPSIEAGSYKQKKKINYMQNKASLSSILYCVSIISYPLFIVLTEWRKSRSFFKWVSAWSNITVLKKACCFRGYSGELWKDISLLVGISWKKYVPFVKTI